MSRAAVALIGLVTAVAAVGAVGVWVASDDDTTGLSVGRTVGPLLEKVCPEGAVVTDGHPSGTFVEQLGEPIEYGRCSEDDHDIVAFVVETEPDGWLVQLSDGAETGDGISVRSTYIERDGRWVAVYSYGGPRDGSDLAPLRDEGFHVDTDL